MVSKTLLIILSLSIAIVSASINEIKDYKLAERELGYRNRFVFSDWKSFIPL